ncbi:sensor histidine kinase [Jeotgalibacillus proteolyticus]|uniref:sensor histidine kinase n=1 Tax=Jeotgalibacillus proteolyticus TaxID=2082395 RepID=UPI003CEF7651
MSKLAKSLWPKQILWRLTFLNVTIVITVIALSSFAIYSTACILVEGIDANPQRQNQFNGALLHYLWIYSILIIMVGSLIHFHLTTKLIRPLKKLIESTKSMKEGRYPETIEAKAEGEMSELITQFNELVLQLKSNEDSRRKIVTDLSHEFRTPLSNLIGYMNALSNGVIEGDPKLFQSLHGESKRLESMVEQFEQLKEWDHASTQKFSEKRSQEIKNLIEQVAEMFHWRLKEKTIQLKIDAEPGKAHVYDTGIQQVLSNMIDNAIRYYSGKEPICIHGEVVGEEYRVSIISEGNDICEEDKTKIFERFYRTNATRRSDTGGSGLGLAISKEIIEQHRGEIGVYSHDGYHHFWFTLPLLK